MDKRFTHLVEKFLDKSLLGTEILEFEKYLKDPICAEYLKKAEFAEKLIEEGIKIFLTDAEKNKILNYPPDDIPEEIVQDAERFGGKGESRFREVIEKAHQNMLNRRKRIRLFSYGSVAAAVLIGIVFIFTFNYHKTPQDLYKKYYKPYDYFAFRSLPETNPIYNKAIVAYKSGDYEVSARLCRENLNTAEKMAEVLFLYGLNLMEMDSLQTAIQQFHTVCVFPIAKDGSLYITSHWYTGLSYLSIGEVDSALIELGAIQGISNLFVKEIQVQELVGEIELLLKKQVH